MISPPGIPVRGPQVTGNVRLLKGFHSEALGGERDVVVYLPPGYENSHERYPVVYLQDGQNLFDPRTAFMGREWHLDETAERLISEGKMPPVILVGPYNGEGKRIDEYTQVPDPEHGGGKADGYGKFLVDELKPWVDGHFRTRAEPSSTAIMGSSLGGLVSLYLSWKNPDVFGVAGALSPSLWWADRELTKAMAADPRFQGPQRLWMDMGTAESQQDDDGNGVPDVIDSTRELRDVLVSHGYREGESLLYHEVAGATHDETAWANRADEVLMSLFRR